MKAYQTTRMVEQPFWACLDAEHAHATEPLANACIRASESVKYTLADIFDVEPLPKLSKKSALIKPKTKRGKRGV